MSEWFAVSLYPAPASTSIAPEPRELTWEQLTDLLTHHERRLNKDGRGWSPARLKPDTTRKNENIEEVTPPWLTSTTARWMTSMWSCGASTRWG